MTGRCVACGQEVEVQAHHVSGRGGPGLGYLDPAFTADLCKACHDLEHAALRRAGLAWPRGSSLAHRLARSAALLNRLVDAGRLPAWLRPLLGLLAEAAEALGQRPRRDR